MTENTRRLKSCIEAWPDCYEGGYAPACCRFPKSCSCDIVHNQALLDDPKWREENLEPLPQSDPQHVDSTWLDGLGTISSREAPLSNDALVEMAYDEAKERIVNGLAGDLRFRDGVVEKSDGAYEAVWAEMRKKGVPDRRAERDAYLKLLEQVRRLEFPAGWGDDELERQESGRSTDHQRTP